VRAAGSRLGTPGGRIPGYDATSRVVTAGGRDAEQGHLTMGEPELEAEGRRRSRQGGVPGDVASVAPSLALDLVDEL
jgi:hypothetical protein